MIIKEVEVKDYLSKSNLPLCDYVINPYVGCPHGCKYCYASFMKRFTGHKEKWGTFLDIKFCDKAISKKKLQGKSVFLSSVTDPYNPYEKKYEITRKILSKLLKIDCHVYIATKSSLIIRDVDLLKQFKNLTVIVSLNTLDENFRKGMDSAYNVRKRLETLKKLYDNGFYTVLFIAPWFPEVTDFKALIQQTHKFVSQYWFENFNLRGDYKKTILDYILNNYPKYFSLYKKIYSYRDYNYWKLKETEFINYCQHHNISYVDCFYHSKSRRI